jgi:uncharacterized protein YaeQ
LYETDPEDAPALTIRDLTGRITSWIDIGSQDAARLHKASKAAPRVVVYTHKDPEQLVARLAGEKIHKADTIEIYAIDRRLIAALVERLDRRMAFSLSIAGGELFVSVGNDTLTGVVSKLSIG